MRNTVLIFFLAMGHFMNYGQIEKHHPIETELLNWLMNICKEQHL